jgi:hypothetical protein
MNIYTKRLLGYLRHFEKAQKQKQIWYIMDLPIGKICVNGKDICDFAKVDCATILDSIYSNSMVSYKH